MKKLLYFSVLFCSILCFSQTLSSTLDKTTLALGEPAFLKINIENLQAKDVRSAPKNELLPFHFEVTRDVINKQEDLYTREIEFAVFEEGTFEIPALDFKIGDRLYKTVPYEIEVVNTAQKDDKISDIMNNKEVSLELKDYWDLYKFYVLAAIALIALIIAIYYIIRYGRKNKDSPVVNTNKTLKELEVLKNKKFIEEGNYRSFYVELIDITRNFITSQYQIPANVLLTDDLITIMKINNTISPDNEKVVEDVFLRGDLVKFAKTFPDQSTMDADFESVRNFVKKSIEDIEFENIRSDV